VPHEVEWGAREKGLPESEISDGMDAARIAINMMARGSSTEEYDAAMKPFRSRDSWPDNFPLIDERPRGQNWIRLNTAYDSVDSIRKIHVPILWFLADNDHNVPTAISAPRLHQAFDDAGNHDATLIVLKNAGHGFTSTTTGNNKDFAKQSHFAAGYWDTMAQWLKARGFAN